MPVITFYLDFISPYAYLAFEQLPRALQGLSYRVQYLPILFAALLKHHGQLGPAEIAPKRAWTYRQVLWHAHALGIALELPARHPFNPLPLLRLALGCSAPAWPGSISRYVAETIFRHIWVGGAEADDPARLQQLAVTLAPQGEPGGATVKAQLKHNTDQAIAHELFGVPAFAVDGRVFWGLDALPMLRDHLQRGTWACGPDWDIASQVGAGVVRKNPRLHRPP
ncbi:MAG: 2-hydroxychromene-2-carboxylate isomerase [Polaromonas sp.]|nr:2-hydroxychromene-2-carboxylate isomerase [Polaromonas sp.]